VIILALAAIGPLHLRKPAYNTKKWADFPHNRLSAWIIREFPISSCLASIRNTPSSQRWSRTKVITYLQQFFQVASTLRNFHVYLFFLQLCVIILPLLGYNEWSPTATEPGLQHQEMGWLSSQSAECMDHKRILCLGSPFTVLPAMQSH
jgi:hypothetical protein